MDHQEHIVYSHQNVVTGFAAKLAAEEAKAMEKENFRNDEQGQAPLDQDGHSTHTASTTAGNFVQGASVFGKVNVTAVGMAP
ncbi:hypothetical protein SCA6_005217 [Theobroma cacao]